MGEADAKALANAGWNEWLAALPHDDWGDLYENSIPIRWDEEAGEWVDVKLLAIGCTCGDSVTFENPHLGQRRRCRECGRMLTIVKIEGHKVGVFVADWGDVWAGLPT